MNFITPLAALGALTFLGAAPHQEVLTPKTDQEPARATADFDSEEWAGRLTISDLGQRMAAYEALVKLAQSDEEAYAQVREWARETSNGELSWTAQLMLREIDADPMAGLRRNWPFSSPGQGWPDAFDRAALEKLLEELTHGTLLDMQGGRSLWKGVIGGSDWDSLFRFDFDSPGQGFSFDSSDLDVEFGPDGVKVEVQENVDGEMQTKTYEAESIEDLLELHPELADLLRQTSLEFRVKDNPGLPDPWRGGRERSYQPFSGRDLPRLNRGMKALRPSLDMLGIRMITPDQRQTSFEDVANDVGLLVVEVVPGTLAEALQIEAGELVISIAGRTIRGAKDVRDVLGTLSLDETIEVECVRPDGSRRVRVWEPKEPEQPERPEGPKELKTSKTRRAD